MGPPRDFYHTRDLYLNKTLRSAGDWIIKQCLKSPEGSIPQVLQQNQHSEKLQRIISAFSYFNSIYFICLNNIFFVFALKDDVMPNIYSIHIRYINEVLVYFLLSWNTGTKNDG